MMKNFTRLYVVESGESSGWTDSTRTGFTITVRDDILTINKKFGRDMFPSEVNTCFGRFLLDYEQEVGEKVALSTRKSHFRFVYRTGMSGAQDTYIEYDPLGDGFPQRKFLCHQSCFGKTEGPKEVWIFDYLDLCLAENVLMEEDGFYRYDPSKDPGASLEAKAIRPRYVLEEEGWNSPHWRDTGTGIKQVVPLKVCREKPEGYRRHRVVGVPPVSQEG